LHSTNKDVNIEDAVLVVAHPDDEILWASSLLSKVKRIIFCFSGQFDKESEITKGRRVVKEKYPFQNVIFLGLNEAEIYNYGNWRDPKISKYGMDVYNDYPGYKENYEILLSLLQNELKECDIVFTHNPWGEYGHEEHVQVFRVIQDLSNKLNLSVNFSSYYSEKSRKFMMQHKRFLSSNFLIQETDNDLYCELRKLYLEHDCWTWEDNYSPPKFEVFYSLRENPIFNDSIDQSSVSLPMNFIWMNPKSDDDINCFLVLFKKFILSLVPDRFHKHLADIKENINLWLKKTD